AGRHRELSRRRYPALFRRYFASATSSRLRAADGARGRTDRAGGLVERTAGVRSRRRSERGTVGAGADGMRRRTRPARRRPDLPALITGGAGFIGTNVA